MKITNERLREFNQNNAAAPVSYDRQQFFEANIAALDRLAKLEAAVEWHGFDEKPTHDMMCLFACRSNDGDGKLVIDMTAPYKKSKNVFLIRDKEYSPKEIKKLDIGRAMFWRELNMELPVGDLS